jgi:hypothetical protein
VLFRNESEIKLEGKAGDLQAALDTLIYFPQPDANIQNSGLDHLCIALGDVEEARGFGQIRNFVGCWDVEIVPMNDPPVLSVEHVNDLTSDASCLDGGAAESPIVLRIENFAGEPVALPAIRIRDVDADDLELEGPAVQVLVHAEEGHVIRPQCPGVQTQLKGAVLEEVWEIGGSVHLVDSCLGNLRYAAASSTFSGRDVLVFEATDLGHNGLLPDLSHLGHSRHSLVTGQREGVIVFRVPLNVTPVTDQVMIEVGAEPVRMARDSRKQLSAIRLKRTPLQDGMRVAIVLEASSGTLMLDANRGWLRERSTKPRTPLEGVAIE